MGNNSTMMNSLFSYFGGSSELLVCETDGFSLRAAIVKNSGYKASVLYSAHSPMADMAEALKEVVEKLKSAGWKGNSKAILLSPAVLSTLVELPIDPKKSRPIPQMQELIRWEVEPLLMQHTTRWTVGHLLVGQGYMSAEQAQTVMDMQQGKANPTGELQTTDKLSLRRFGDLAEELGYIRRSQLNACLSGQEWLKSEDEEVACGWSAQTEVEDVPGSYGWLVSCVSKGLLARWEAAFKTHNIKLQAMYPLTGSSNTLHKTDNASSVVIESHKGMAFISKLRDGAVTTQHQYVNPQQTDIARCLESFHSVTTPSNTVIQLASWQEDSQSLVSELSSSLEREVIPLATDIDASQISAGMLGAATHAFKTGKSALVADVRIGGPLPPATQRPEIRAAALAGCLLLLIGFSEASLAILKSQALAEKDNIDTQWEIIANSNKRITAQANEIEKRKEEIAKQEQEQKRMQALIDFYGHDIPERVSLVQSLLGIFQSTITDEVMLISIDEFGKRASFKQVISSTISQDNRVEVENFNVDAWALSETAAQSFIQNLKQAIEPWGLEIRDPKVVSRQGPLNLPGFGIGFRIVKLAMADDADTKVAKR
jgi:hypothetical protein